MATRSAIAVEYGNVIKGIYCHWDGYPSHNGAILQEHYTRPKASNLIALGDLSSLRKNIGEAHPFSKYEVEKDNPDFDKLVELYERAEAEEWCTFYGRDRGEENTSWKTFNSRDEFVEAFDGNGCEYFYLLDNDGVWHVNAYGRGWELLTECLRRQEEEAA